MAAELVAQEDILAPRRLCQNTGTANPRAHRLVTFQSDWSRFQSHLPWGSLLLCTLLHLRTTRTCPPGHQTLMLF